jgi:hypothetical protein
MLFLFDDGPQLRHFHQGGVSFSLDVFGLDCDGFVTTAYWDTLSDGDHGEVWHLPDTAAVLELAKGSGIGIGDQFIPMIDTLCQVNEQDSVSLVASQKVAMPMPTQLPESWKLKEVSEDKYNRTLEIRSQYGDVVALLYLQQPKPNLWKVAYVKNNHHRVGWGAFLYERALEWITSQGGTLESDSTVSNDAAKVWDKYYTRDDVERELSTEKPRTNPKDELREEDSLKYRYRKKSQIIDEDKFVTKVSDVLFAHIDDLNWEEDVLNGGATEHAIVTRIELGEWLKAASPDAYKYILSTSSTDQGLRLIGDAFVLAGIADSVKTGLSEENTALVLYRLVEE